MNIINKAIFIFLTALIAVFLFFKPVYAKSGCCSSHNGVCCECGPQANGKVICNDGWRGSSCYYSEMVKCGGYSPPEPIPVTENPPVAPTAPLEPSLAPIVVFETPLPLPSPSPSPTPFPSPSPSPTPSPSPSPSPSPEPEQPSPTPEVKGETVEKEEPASILSDVVGLAILGGLGWGGYKLIKKIIKRKFS